MVEVINLHFDAINKLTRKVPVHFNKDVLYNFRVEIKKLRAFLQLVKTEPGSSDCLKVKKRLKGQELLRLVREAVENRRDDCRREFFVCLLNFREKVADA